MNKLNGPIEAAKQGKVTLAAGATPVAVPPVEVPVIEVPEDLANASKPILLAWYGHACDMDKAELQLMELFTDMYKRDLLPAGAKPAECMTIAKDAMETVFRFTFGQTTAEAIPAKIKDGDVSTRNSLYDRWRYFVRRCGNKLWVLRGSVPAAKPSLAVKEENTDNTVRTFDEQAVFMAGRLVGLYRGDAVKVAEMTLARVKELVAALTAPNTAPATEEKSA